jgi:hypothetical protein
MKNRDIEVGAKAIASDLTLPGGRRKKLARVVEDHLAWFDAAEARGMTWEDMVAVLSAAGVKGGTGRRLTVGSLSSAVWRKRNEPQPPRRSVRRTQPQRLVPRAEKRPGQARPSRSSRSKEALERAAPSPARPVNSGQRGAKPTSPGTDVLAFMQRAAKMRRGPEE